MKNNMCVFRDELCNPSLMFLTTVTDSSNWVDVDAVHRMIRAEEEAKAERAGKGMAMMMMTVHQGISYQIPELFWLISSVCGGCWCCCSC